VVTLAIGGKELAEFGGGGKKRGPHAKSKNFEKESDSGAPNERKSSHRLRESVRVEERRSGENAASPRGNAKRRSATR